MPGFEDLLHADLGKLNEAVADWETQVTRLEEMHEDRGVHPPGQSTAQTLTRLARTAAWSGENAAVTVPYVVREAAQFETAVTQATTLRELCRDGYARLKRCQDDLKTIVETDAPNSGVHVSSSGRVTADLDGLDGETRRERQDAVMAISERITDVLRRTAEEDALIAQALRDAMGTDPARFSAVDYGSVDEAAQAHRDAQAALALMEQGEELSNEQLAEITGLLDAHADDPAFAERIATGLGAEGTVDFWTAVSMSRDIRMRDTEEWDMVAGLQTSLGTALGLATQSDSPVMERWEREMTGLGAERVGDNARHPYGFQTMSALMNAGEYDPDFLLDYGDALLTFEQEDDRRASQLWDTDNYLTLNWATADAREGNAGRDPMTGFLTALGNSPEAATTFFAPPDAFDPAAHVDLTDEESVADNLERMNDRLAYLATERDWWNSARHAGVPEGIPVHGSLGDALLAATTGYASAEWDPEHLDPELTTDRRTPETAAVMEQVIQLYGVHDPLLLEEQPVMAQSLGLMTAAYIDDIDYLVSGMGDHTSEETAAIFNSPYDGQLDNTQQNAIQFLNVLGHNETSYSIASQAQNLYTLGNLDAFRPTDEASYGRGAQSLWTGAEVHGILDGARIHQIDADFGEATREAQEAQESSSGWWKASNNALIGAGVGAATAATAASGGATAVVVPIAAAAAGVFLGEFAGQGIDGGDAERDSTAQQQASGDLVSDSRQHLGSLARRYEALADDSINTMNLFNETKELHDTGMGIGRTYDHPGE